VSIVPKEQQKTNMQFTENNRRLSGRMRLLAAGIFVAAAVVFGLLWAAAEGYVDLSRWVGICGFKQRYGLPCPGCGWTHAAQAFAQGHPIEAFKIQPAACIFCLTAAITAFFALLYALFGIKFLPLERLFSSTTIRNLIIAGILVIMTGWIVTLIRTVLENAKP